MTGLAAGSRCAAPVLEAAAVPGGLCASYGVAASSAARGHTGGAPKTWRFERGGGHWIFGGDAEALRLLRSLAPMREFRRRAAVLFSRRDLLVPYPVQNHLHRFDAATIRRVIEEIGDGRREPEGTLHDWALAAFGPTLFAIFFEPFLERYTAGLWRSVAPEDPYKVPFDRERILRGAAGRGAGGGYNATFLYPANGLDALARGLAAGADVRYGRRVEAIDPGSGSLRLANGDRLPWECLIATLPLHELVAMSGVVVASPPDPWTSVLVLNVGARRGTRCPVEHWLYVPDARSGFFRVGFYSNVTPSFLPADRRTSGDWVSLYVERAFLGGARPDAAAVAAWTGEVLAELGDWQIIGDVEVVDATWIDTAYTWRRPGSRWPEQAIAALEHVGIHAAGRYGRWTFQGIADSVRDGLAIGERLGRESI